MALHAGTSEDPGLLIVPAGTTGSLDRYMYRLRYIELYSSKRTKFSTSKYEYPDAAVGEEPDRNPATAYCKIGYRYRSGVGSYRYCRRYE